MGEERNWRWGGMGTGSGKFGGRFLTGPDLGKIWEMGRGLTVGNSLRHSLRSRGKWERETLVSEMRDWTEG